jgi:hypothetical protein
VALAADVAAQPGAKRPLVVVLHPASVEGSAVYQHLVPRLAQLGYVDGKTMTLDLRSGHGVMSALPRSSLRTPSPHGRMC